MALRFFGFNSTQAKTLEDRLAELEAVNTSLEAVNTSQATSITNLNAWATALATKLNADAGVTDTNYDTDPQA